MIVETDDDLARVSTPSSRTADDAIPRQRNILRGFIQEKRTLPQFEKEYHKDDTWKRPRFGFADADDPCCRDFGLWTSGIFRV